MNRQLAILVLEDEQRAGEKLIDLIRDAHPPARITWYRSIREGVGFLRGNDPVDLIFSDIELLDGNAFRIFEQVRPRCPVIFCTAYDTYYVDAFQANGIAYLLKPYTREQFQEAWDKYRLLFDQAPPTAVPEAFLTTLQSLVARERPSYKTTFSVKKREGVFLLKTESIAYFQAQGDFVLAIDRAGDRHALSHSLGDIETLLDPTQFFRINRGEIVNLDGILKYAPYRKNRLAVTLSAPSVVLYTTNSRAAAFRDWLESR